jgi:hypothetical protein
MLEEESLWNVRCSFSCIGGQISNKEATGGKDKG